MRTSLSGIVLGLAAVLLWLAPAEAAVYWSTADGKIGKAAIDGGSPNYDFIPGATASSGVATNGTYVFWGRQGAVGRANVDGSAPNPNFAGDGNCNVLSVAANATHVYWLSSCASPAVRYVRRMPVGGGGMELVHSGPSLAACGIAIDGTYVYWTDFDRVGRIPLGGGTPEPDWRVLTLPAQTQACGLAVDTQYVYFGVSGTHSTAGTTIGRFSKDGSGTPDNSFITGARFLGGSANPVGLAVDADHVYWGHQGDPAANSSIGRAGKDASGVDPSFVAGVFFPKGVAVDATASGADADADGVPDATDNCPALANPDQADSESDGQGDTCDTDDDNDARGDGEDNCPTATNAGQEDLDGDGAGDACDLDDDNDGVADATDNCPLIANGDQRDDDLDGLGRACDQSDVAPPPPPMRIVFVDNSNPRFVAGGTSTPVTGQAAQVPRGTTFTYELAEAGEMRIRVQRAMPGRRSGGRCRKPTRRLRAKRPCTRWVTKHTLRRTSRAGVNAVAYSGRVRGKALRPGRHRAVFTASAPGRSRSEALRVSFRVVRR